MTRSIPKPPINIAGYDPLRTAGDCIWDGVEAARAVDFFPENLRFVEGKWAGQPFKLEKWQSDYIATLYGWKRPDKTRRYRESCLFIPRKNSKTTMAAGMALYGLTCDGETGAQVYTAAFSRDQASLIFSPAAKMVHNSPQLAKRLKVIDSVKRITYQQTGSFLRSIPADAANSHGFNAHQVFFDELHGQTKRDLYDVLKSSMGARRQPLFVSMSTAGYDRHSICYEVWNMARQIRDGDLDNPYFLPCIYELPEGATWGDEDVWHKVNPNLGVSISLGFLREECQRAKDSPAYENTFRNLYLNQWCEQAVRWISMDKWHLGDDALPDLTGEPCWVGVDLSTTRDITALVAAFPRPDGGYYLLCRFWVPTENGRKRERMDGVPYLQWAKDKANGLTLTDGDAIDQGAIRAAVNDLASQYSVQEVAIDPWNAMPLLQALQGDGINAVEHRQGFASMANPTKEFDRLIVDGKIQHGNNPVLTWMAGNATVEIDAAENMKPSKKKSTERIDGIVAAVMAVGRAATAEKQDYWSPSDGVLL
jgi:phage terminase large subunit-like protein